MGASYRLFVLVRVLIDNVIDFFFGLYFQSRRKELPPIKNVLVLESACSLVKKIRNREVKVEEVVSAFVERTEQVNVFLNAMVSDRFMDALKEARKLDEDIRYGKLSEQDFENKPLLGIPFTTKESMASKGLKWTLGLLARTNVIAEEDAKVIRLMKQAGAIHIGVTNVPQLNFWAESYNPVYGTCCNPYDTTRNAGGSSGGEGSIISACGSPIGLGTDIAGSIRIPAHRCGVFGHKTIPNLIPTEGQSFSKGTTPTLSVIGPMAKRAEDLLPIFKILLAENVNKLKLDAPVRVDKLKVFYMTSIRCLWCSPVQKELQGCVMKVVRHFEEISGTKPIRMDLDDLKYAMKLWSYKLRSIDGLYFNENITNKTGRANVPLEYIKYIFGMSEYNLYSLLNMINYLTPSVDFQWAEETLTTLKEALLAQLGDNGVLIFPSEPRAADYHYTTLLRPGLSYFCIWNALEMPVTQVPLGLNSTGVPIGVQIVTTPYNDHLSLAVAKELETAFGGYTPLP